MEITYLDRSASNNLLQEPEFLWQEDSPEKKVITLKACTHKGEKRLQLLFGYDKELIDRLRSHPDCRWSKTMHCWHVPYSEDFNRRLRLMLGDISVEICSSEKRESKKNYLSNRKKEALQQFEIYLKSRHYSESTIRSYIHSMKMLLLNYSFKNIDQISNIDIMRYCARELESRRSSDSGVNILINEIKLFFLKIENRELDLEKLERPRKWHYLPQVFSKEEVEKILKCLKNVNDSTMIALIYSTG